MRNIQFIYQCIVKDFRIQKSYSFDTLLRIIGILLQVILFFYIGKLIGIKQGPLLEISHGEYFPFVVIGLAFSSIFSCGLSVPSQWIREEIAYGTIEHFFSLPVPLKTMLAGLGASRFLYAIIECVIILGIGFLIAPFSLSALKIIYSSILIAVSGVLFYGIGLIAGSFILIFKRGDPIQWVIVNSSDILGGVYFPITVFPSWLHAIALCLPTTHILTCARKILLSEANGTCLGTVAVLSIVSLVIIWIGFFSFAQALMICRRKGMLAHF